MKERVRRYYQRRAATYEDLNLPDTIVAAVRAIGIADHLDIMQLQGGEVVLDVGCGQGRFLKPIAEKARVYGVDFTSEMLEKAKGKGAGLIRADAEHLPFKDQVFDVVHSAGLLGVYRSREVCREMARVVKKGGRLYVSFPAAKSVSGFLVKLLSPIGWNPTLLDHWYSEREIREMFPEEIKIKRYHKLGFEPPFQRLYKTLRSKKLVRMFVFLEKRLRDIQALQVFKGRILMEGVK